MRNRLISRFIVSSVLRSGLAVSGMLTYPVLSIFFPIMSGGLFEDRLTRGIAALLTVLLTIGALSIHAVPFFGRLLISVVLGCISVIVLSVGRVSPMTFFTGAVLLLVSGSLLWSSYSHRHPSRDFSILDRRATEIRTACIAGIILWGIYSGLNLLQHLDCRISLMVAFALILQQVQKLFFGPTCEVVSVFQSGSSDWFSRVPSLCRASPGPCPSYPRHHCCRSPSSVSRRCVVCTYPQFIR